MCAEWSQVKRKNTASLLTHFRVHWRGEPQLSVAMARCAGWKSPTGRRFSPLLRPSRVAIVSSHQELRAAMRRLQPVIWSKGTFLTPQHLQLQDRFIEDSLQFRLEALRYCAWGFSE